MADSNEIKQTPIPQEDEQFEGGFTPIVKFSQDFDNLSKSGKLEYPKYRTLSQEQSVSYIKLNELPEYKRLQIKNDIKAASSPSFIQDAKNSFINTAVNEFSIKDRIEMWLGNMLVTEDYSPAAELAVQLGAVAKGVGSAALFNVLSPTEMGDSTLRASLDDIESAHQNALKRLKESFERGEMTKEVYKQNVSAYEQQYQKRLESLDEISPKPTHEIKGEGKEKTKLQQLGLAMIKDSLDSMEYRTAVLPTVNQDSWGSLAGSATASVLGYFTASLGGRALGRGVAKPLAKRAKQPHSQDVKDRYVDIVGTKGARAGASAFMFNEVMAEGALSSIEQYIEDTGDVNLDNYTGDLSKVGYDIISYRLQDILEDKIGFGRFINKRIASKYGEWLNGFAQEFTQGEVSDIFEWIKGNQTFEEVIKNIPNNLKAGVIGSPLQGIPGTAYYTYYHNKTVNDLTDAVMSQSTPENPLDQKKVRSFVEDKVRQLEEGAMIDMAKELSDFSGATQYRGKIYDTIRDNVEKTINYQREVMKDTLEGSKYDDMSEEELAQHIEAVAEDNADRAVIDALERKVPLSESPLLKGETLEGTYYVEGSDYAKETERQAQENRQMIRDAVYAAKQAEKSAKETVSELKKLNLSMQAEKLDVKLPTQPNDKVAFEHKNQQFEVVRGFDSNTVNLAVDGDKVSAIEVKDDGMVRDTNTLPEMQNQGLATEVVLMAENLFGDLTITVAEGNKKAEEFWFNKMGYTEEIAPRTYKKAKQVVSDVDLQYQDPVMKQAFDIADENARLDEVNPEYTGETIEVNGVERTVYNSNGERIAKSEPALRNFWNWFGDSKVVDEDGRPLVVYHGTNAKFDTFDKEKALKNTRMAELGTGFYFDLEESNAESYGDMIMPVYLHIEKPFVATQEQFNSVGIKTDGSISQIEDIIDVISEFGEDKFSKKIQKLGFDGIMPSFDINSQIVVFEPNQIKSVDNRGTFSPDTGNIYYQDRQRGKGGAYDARTRSITLGGGANVTTFFHEFAHYWIDKNFKWARSGKASTAWMQQWRMVEKWLGIDPEDKYLDKIASEKFARAYERFLAEEELPLVLKKAMIDYRDFVLDHYDYELDDAKGLQDKLGRPIRLDDSIKAWFKKSIYQEYMSPAEMEVVNERLALDDQERKDIIPQLEEASEMQAEIANSPELNKIDITGGQIQREAGISNAQILGKRTIGGGEEKTSKGKIAQELGKTYESTNWDIQEQMVSEYLETVSLDEAIDDLDNETYPEKIDANFLRQALVERLLESGRELEAVALIEQTADDFTQAAQTLQAARKINTPFTNAIRMLTVGKAEKLAQARYGRNENAVAELDKAMNALIDKYQSDFMNAKTEEERELVYATMQDEAIKTIGTLDKSRKNDLDFQDTEDKEERKQAKAIRKQQIRRASINGYRSRAKRALKQALGLEPTRQQVRDIKKLSVEVAKQIRDFRKAVNENKTSAIDPTKVLVAQNKLNEYMNKQLPPRVLSTVADATNSFMMANMLWNPATNVFNLESTWVQMLPHMIATRINYGGGTIAWSEKAKLIKQALALQTKTGYNIFSLRDFFDKKTIWAEKYYEPTTSIGKFQRFPLTALGLMDTMNKGIVFLHHADSMATKQAKEEGAKNGWNKEQVEKRAKELFYQALNTDPRTITIDGLKIRKAAVQEGEEATFTQMTKTAELVNKFRKMLNLGGKTGLGNIIMPFTTTVANIAEDTVLNYALGSVRGLVNAPQAIATQFDKTATAEMKKEAWKAVQPETKNVIKNMIGILMILGVALSGTDDDEYVLGYDRQTDVDKDIRTNRNAPYGYAVKIGDKWVDLDLFGIGSPWAKMYLIAKRYGFSTDGWVKGVASNIDLIPGVGELSSMYEKYTTTQERQGSAEAWVEMGAEKLEELSVRLIPMSALFGQLASIADDKKRETWNNWYDKMLAKIPYAREKLPARTSTQTGKELPQTDTIWNLATGQRIKDYIEPSGADKARYEFALEDKTLAYREGNSKLKELGKDTVRYKNAVNKVRKLFSKKLSEESKKASYKRLSIEEKKKVANKLHKEALESVKAEYGLAKKNKKR